eukprot:m51a1_g2084 hypothetical protein (636) ;mRNA; f:1510387-1512714
MVLQQLESPGAPEASDYSGPPTCAASATQESSPAAVSSPQLRCAHCQERLDDMKAAGATIPELQYCAALWDAAWSSSGVSCWGACCTRLMCVEHARPLPGCDQTDPPTHTPAVYTSAWLLQLPELKAEPGTARKRARTTVAVASTSPGPCAECQNRVRQLACSEFMATPDVQARIVDVYAACGTACQGFCTATHCCKVHVLPAVVGKEAGAGGHTTKFHCPIPHNPLQRGRHHEFFCYYCADPTCCNGRWFSREETHRRSRRAKAVAKSSSDTVAPNAGENSVAATPGSWLTSFVRQLMPKKAPEDRDVEQPLMTAAREDDDRQPEISDSESGSGSEDDDDDGSSSREIPEVLEVGRRDSLGSRDGDDEVPPSPPSEGPKGQPPVMLLPRQKLREPSAPPKSLKPKSDRKKQHEAAKALPTRLPAPVPVQSVVPQPMVVHVNEQGQAYMVPQAASVPRSPIASLTGAPQQQQPSSAPGRQSRSGPLGGRYKFVVAALAAVVLVLAVALAVVASSKSSKSPRSPDGVLPSGVGGAYMCPLLNAVYAQDQSSTPCVKCRATTASNTTYTCSKTIDDTGGSYTFALAIDLLGQWDLRVTPPFVTPVHRTGTSGTELPLLFTGTTGTGRSYTVSFFASK